jgi:hypothetical protein
LALASLTTHLLVVSEQSTISLALDGECQSLSRAGVRRLIGRRLPDAILHGKRSFRPRSRAVQRLAAAGFRVRLFSSLELVVAPPAYEPGQDTSAICFPRLDRLAPGQPPLLAARSPGATGLASSLSGCLLLTGRRCVFYIAGALEGFHGSCRDRVSFPIRTLTLSRLSASFDWQIPPQRDRQSRPTVLMHSSNRIPSG